jgi:hypothetical protein
MESSSNDACTLSVDTDAKLVVSNSDNSENHENHENREKFDNSDNVKLHKCLDIFRLW